jgi:hypothetical protein
MVSTKSLEMLLPTQKLTGLILPKPEGGKRMNFRQPHAQRRGIMQQRKKTSKTRSQLNKMPLLQLLTWTRWMDAQTHNYPDHRHIAIICLQD